MTSARARRLILLGLIGLCGCLPEVRAQETTHTVFAELLGTSGLGSLNYELTVHSVALRAGIGTLWLIPTHPLTVSYRFGRDTRAVRFDVGGGVVLLRRPDFGDGWFAEAWEESFERQGAIACGVVAARYDLPDSPFVLRLSMTAFVSKEPFPWPGFGVGFRFAH